MTRLRVSIRLFVYLLVLAHSYAAVLPFSARKPVIRPAGVAASFRSRIKSLADSNAVVPLSLFGFGKTASELLQRLTGGVTPEANQPVVFSVSELPGTAFVALKEEPTAEAGGFSGLPTQAAVCVVSEHDVKEKRRMAHFVDYFIENCSRLPDGCQGRLVIGVLDSGSGKATNEVKQLLQESHGALSRVDVRILQLDEKDPAAAVLQLQSALQGISPMTVSEARSLAAHHEVISPVERSASAECTEAAEEARGTFKDKMEALSEAVQNNLMLDIGEVLDALMQQALVAFDDSTATFKGTEAQRIIRNILIRDMTALAQPIYAKQLELVRTVAIDEFRKAVQDIRVGPTLVSDIDRAIKMSLTVFDRHAKQIRPKRGERLHWNSNFERAQLERTLAEYRQTAVDTARAQGLPDHPVTRKPITLTFHWLITKLPVMDFRQQVVGLHEKPFLESKDKAVPPNKLTFYERAKMLERRVSQIPIVGALKQGLLGGYVESIEAPRRDLQFDAERYHYIQEEVGDRFVEDDPTEEEFSRATLRDAQSYLDYARPNTFWHAFKKGAWEKFDEINESVDNLLRSVYETVMKDD